MYPSLEQTLSTMLLLPLETAHAASLMGARCSPANLANGQECCVSYRKTEVMVTTANMILYEKVKCILIGIQDLNPKKASPVVSVNHHLL